VQFGRDSCVTVRQGHLHRNGKFGGSSGEGESELPVKNLHKNFLSKGTLYSTIGDHVC